MSKAFAVGDQVRVRFMTPPGHVRTPYFTRGKCGEVVQIAGNFKDPEELAYGRDGAVRALYRVRFKQSELWPDYDGDQGDTLVVDIFEQWLEQKDG